MSPLDLRLRGLLTAAIAVALVGSGCRERPAYERPSSDAKTEPGFAAQAEAVRQGKSAQIRLDYTQIGDDELAHLDGLEDKLERINLSHTTISDAGLARIAEMRRLVQLRLASPRITDAGLACLAQLDALRHLHLIDAPLTDAGLEHLGGLAGLSSLYLDGTRATDAGMAKLVEALPKVHLHIDGGHHAGDPRRGDHEH